MTDTRQQPLGPLRRLLLIGAERPAATLLFLLVVSIVAAWGVLQLKVDSRLVQLVPGDGARHQTYLHIAREFGTDNRSFITLHDDQLWTPEKLLTLKQLHDELQQLPFVERIESVFSLPTVRNVDGQLFAQPLLGDAALDESGAEQARQRVLADELARRNLVSVDGKSLAISVAVREGYAGDHVAAELDRVIEPLREKIPSLVQVGPSRIEAEIRQILLHDATRLLPLFALVLALAILVFCRSMFAAFMPLLVGTLSLLWTLGMMGYAGIPASMLSVMLPVLVIVAGTSKVMRMFSAAHPGPWNSTGLQAVPDRKFVTDFMERHPGLPVGFTVLTMVVGFAGYAFSDIPLVKEFGITAAFAILASGLMTMLLIPALYVSFGSSRPRSRQPGQAGLSSRFSRHIVRVVGLLRSKLAIWLMVILALAGMGLVSQSSRLSLTNDPLGFFRQDRPLALVAERMHAEIAGVKLFYITLDANAEGAFRDPLNLQRLADIQGFIAKQQIFDRSLSLADIVAQANQEAAGGRAEAYLVPATRKLVGQYLLLHSPRDLEPYVSHDMRRANIVVRHNVGNSAALNQAVRELRQAVANYAGPGMVTTVVGENLLINAAADQLLKTHGWVIAALLAVVFVAMTLMFTSVKGGIIALAPGVVPILMMLGGMRILEIPINAGTVMVAILTIGIAIEGTIHSFSRYSALCRSTADYDEAVIETIRREAAPMMTISLALALACSILVFSDFAIIAQFGMLASATLVFSVLANLLITPLVISRIRLVGLYEILAMSLQRDALVNSPLFFGMTDYQIRKTILISELLECRDGERLIEQGTRGRSMYVVVSGQLEVVRHEGAAAYRRALLGPGEVFGEIGFVNETYRIADVRAVGPVSVLRFDHARLKKDLTLFPFIMAKLNFNISGILGRRLVEVVEANPALSPLSAAEVATDKKD